MMPTPPYSRISITLPPEVLAAADRFAKEYDRPRSWVFVEAIRRFGEAEGVGPDQDQYPPDSRAPAEVAVDLGAQSLAQLHADLALSPEERVRASEGRATADQKDLEPRQRTDQILFFDRFEDYLRWDQRSRGTS
ncbi:MAG: CopG family transcriptional regulator [Gemmatimonadota bacterium]|nr:CopG family transcriptional regulator [Gemmatimonadota bacterium]